MAPTPETMVDLQKMIKDFDPTKMVGQFSSMMTNYKVPGLDVAALVESQKKNVEALTSANRLVFEGMQAIAKRQAEILQETMNEASKAIDALAKAGSPQEVAAKQAELAKVAFERALSNMRELADMVTKANEAASGKINDRIAATLDEIKAMALKSKQPAAAAS